MEDVIISVKNIGLSYRRRKSMFRHDRFEALKDVSFDIKRGETVGILGRNGAGKSTLLRILAGIYKPDKGVISNGSKKTSLLALQAGFDQLLNGRDNAMLSGMLMGYSKKDACSKLEEIKLYSELGEQFYRPIKTYSTGMKARLGFATAVNLAPEVLLLDEVLGVGDERFRKKSTKTMAEMVRSDKTVVLVSHSPWAMTHLCNRIVWIEDGVVKEQGNAVEIFERYQKS